MHLLPSLSITPLYIKVYLLNLLVFMWMRICHEMYISILSLKRLLLALVSWRVVGHLLHFEVLSTVYSALVQPYFEYCSVVWGNCNKSLATKVQKLQNRAPCILTFSPCDDASADNPFISLGWKTLDTQRKIQTAAMVYTSLNDLATQYLNFLFSYRNEVSSYSLKDSEEKLPVAKVLETLYCILA